MWHTDKHTKFPLSESLDPPHDVAPTEKVLDPPMLIYT